MLDYNIYEDIGNRSGGDIYIGVVGPVRTGKSTLIKKFMTELVIPNVTDQNARSVMIDELPQSATGRSIMTTEPKFVPNKACRVKIENSTANFRLIDCVGFITDGAIGYEEEGKPRLVKTPWSERPMPFAEAAALGTEKVIKEHSTIGILVTTDGSISDIPRSGYVGAEERTVKALKEIGKPFVIVLNCADPNSLISKALKIELEEKYNNAVIAVNCEKLESNDLLNILKEVLFEFPVLSFDINIPEWMRYLSASSSAIGELVKKVRSVAPKVEKMKDLKKVDLLFTDCEFWKNQARVSMNLSEGRATIDIAPKDGIFFNMLSEIAGEGIFDECSLMKYVRGTSEAKKNYDKIKDGFECARVNGYGIVSPDDDNLSLEQPRVVRQGGSVGVKLKGTAPSYHIVKVDVTGEVAPIMGSASQSEEMVKGLMASFENNPENMWETNIFGKSLRGMVSDGLSGKSNCLQVDTKSKIRRALTRMVNESKGSLICILL